MTEKSYTLSYLFLVLRVRNLAPKKQVTATLKNNRKKEKKKGRYWNEVRAYLRNVSIYFLQKLRLKMRPQLINGESSSTINSLLLPFGQIRAGIDKIYRSQHKNTIHIIRWQADPGNI